MSDPMDTSKGNGVNGAAEGVANLSGEFEKVAATPEDQGVGARKNERSVRVQVDTVVSKKYLILSGETKLEIKQEEAAKSVQRMVGLYTNSETSPTNSSLGRRRGRAPSLSAFEA